MKLLFKQKFFSWFDSFDIFDEEGNIYYTVKGKPGFGHKFAIYDKNGNEIAMLREKVFTILHKFIMEVGGNEVGIITKEISLFKPKFSISAQGYEVEGDWFQWDYNVKKDGVNVATISKEVFHFTDTYVINTQQENSLVVLMIVLAIDAIKCDHSTDD